MQQIDRTLQEVHASVTSKGQVTLPAEVRRVLGIRPRDKVTFAIDRHQVRLVRARYTLESAFGAVDPATRTEDFQRISREAKEAHVARSAASSRSDEMARHQHRAALPRETGH